MRKSVLSLFMLIASLLNGLQAQDQRIVDSLETAIRFARNDIEKYNTLHALAGHYIEAGNEKALQVVNDAEVVAFRSGDTLCTIKIQRLKGQILFRLGMPQEAIATVRPLLNNSSLSKYHNEQLGALNTVAISHLVMSEFDSCLKYQFQTLQVSREVDDYEYAAISLMNIGITYYKLKNYERALGFMLRSYRIQDSLEIVDFSAPMNISLCHTYLQDFDSSEKLLTKSLVACGAECPPRAMLHINYASGCLHFARQDYEDAERAFLASLALSEKLKDFRLFLDNTCMLAKIYIRRNKLLTARKHLERGERVIAAGAPFNMERIKIYEQLAQLYLQLKDFEKTSLYQGKYIQLKDSIYNEVVTGNLMKLESEFLENENQSRIEKQRAVISDNEQTIQRQALLIVVAGLLAIMTIISTIILYRSYRFKRDLNIMLERRVRERTSEIELEVKGIMRELKEKELQMKRLMQAVGETVKSLKGMSNIAKEYVHDADMHVYISKVGETIDRLERIRSLPQAGKS